MSQPTGVLYIIATPIGNLADISQRALDILKTVDFIAAEDTRHTARLLQNYNIQTKMIAYHEHNEAQETPRLTAMLAKGNNIALVSDAGTPLISDPGFRLVHAAKQLDLIVTPIPGPSALICALSACGLPSDRFLFIGFPPRGAEKRQLLFNSLVNEPGTIIFYEAGPRLQTTLVDIDKVFGTTRKVVLARELTKQYETFLTGTAVELIASLLQDKMQTKGEHVILVAGAGYNTSLDTAQAEAILHILLAELPINQAVKLATRITKGKRNELYSMALAIAQTGQDG